MALPIASRFRLSWANTTVRHYCRTVFLYFYDLFPRAAGDAEVSVGGGFLVDGPAQVEAFDDCLRAEVEVFRHNTSQIFTFFVERFYHYRLGAAYCVSDRAERFLGVSVRDQILGDEAAHVCGASVDFHRFFAGETSAAMRHEAAVGVDLDFAAGQSCVRFK